MLTVSKSIMSRVKVVKRMSGKKVGSYLRVILLFLLSLGPYSFPHRRELQFGGEVFDEAVPI